jgi:hypothetical protein
MILLGFLLPMFAPWIPLINRIPDWVPAYKIIYSRYYAHFPPSPTTGKKTTHRKTAHQLNPQRLHNRTSSQNSNA